jgi:hypothetical protein
VSRSPPVALSFSVKNSVNDGPRDVEHQILHLVLSSALSVSEQASTRYL